MHLGRTATDERLTDDRATDDRATDDRVVDAGVTADRSVDDQVADDRTADDRTRERAVGYERGDEFGTAPETGSEYDRDRETNAGRAADSRVAGAAVTDSAPIAPTPQVTGNPATAPGVSSPAAGTGTAGAGAGSSPLEDLLRDNGPRTRWSAIQADFVDDPGRAVADAGELLEETVRRLTDALTAETSSIGAHPGEGADGVGEPSTEDLRLALQRYRGLFDRLLAV